MPVQMAGHTRSRRAAKIQPDVETLGIEHLLKYARHFGDCLRNFQLHVIVKLIKPGEMSQGSDQQMTIVIRISVQQRNGVLPSFYNKPLTVVARRYGLTEEALGIGAGQKFAGIVGIGYRSFAKNVSQPPRCPKLFV